jgi:restriction system protein
MYKFKYKSVTHRFTDALSQLSWQDFELLLATYYATQGYRVEHVGTGGSKTQYDGGIDLKLHRSDEYVVVQCKHWNAGQVTHNTIHELLGVMLTQRATSAIVVTSGEFTQAAKAAASAEPRVHLIDGVTLRAMLGPLLPTHAYGRPANDAASRYTNAFTDPAPDWEGRSPPRRRRGRGRNPLPGIAFALVAAIIAFYVIRDFAPRYAQNVMHTLAPSALPAAPVRQAPMPPPYPPLQTARQQPQRQPATHSLVPTTDAEMEEWKRRNAESMKIIEKSTKEMPLR